VVVGHCAAGKSTLVAGLRALGYDATICGQEHSEIHDLWRHGEPDLVVALTIDLETVRARRGDDWPAAIFAAQEARLADAIAHAHLALDSGRLDPIGVRDAVVCAIERWRHDHAD
jgi:hypothetical protein